MLYSWIYSFFPEKVSLLDSSGSKSDNDFGSSWEEYTDTWVDLVNRGGLHQVSDKFYLLMKEVEMETILNQKL